MAQTSPAVLGPVEPSVRPLAYRLRTYATDELLSDTYAQAMLDAADEMDRLRAIARDAETSATDLMREILVVRRYCGDVQQSGTANERAVAQTVSRMLARPPAA
jgi:hypothetical protein